MVPLGVPAGFLNPSVTSDKSATPGQLIKLTVSHVIPVKNPLGQETGLCAMTTFPSGSGGDVCASAGEPTRARRLKNQRDLVGNGFMIGGPWLRGTARQRCSCGRRYLVCTSAS